MALFQRLSKLVAPRVLSAVVHTLWNGWCTKRRFQVEHSDCIFRCSADNGEDSIEHYAQCPSLSVFLEVLAGDGPPVSMDEFLLLTHDHWEDESLKDRALGLGAIYMAHNHARMSMLLPPNWVHDFIKRTVMHLRSPRHPF